MERLQNYGFKFDNFQTITTTTNFQRYRFSLTIEHIKPIGF